MAKQRGASRFFRIGLEADPTDVVATAYGTPAKGYEDPAVTGASKDMRFFQISEGNFSLKQTPNVEEQPVLRGQLGVHHRDKTGSSVAGDTGVLTHPETIKYFLDAGLRRDAANELAPHTVQEFYPGIDAATADPSEEVGASYIGCKASQIAGAWGTGNNKATITVSWQGQREDPYVNLSNLPLVSAHTKPKSGYYFTNSGLIDLGPAGSPALPLCDYTDVSLSVANNLTEGPRCFNATAALRGAISDLLAGQERVSGSFTLQWRDLTVMTQFRDFTDLGLRNMFIHPAADSSLAFTGTHAISTGTTGTIAVDADPTSLLHANSVIAIQHGGATPTNWSVARVATATSAPNELTLESLDVAIAAGDIIWTEALEITAVVLNITDLDKSGGPEDAVITLSGSFEGKADTAGSQITYKAYGLAAEDGLPRS